MQKSILLRERKLVNSLTLITFILVTITCFCLSCSESSKAADKKDEPVNNKISKEAKELKTDAKYILFFGNSLSAGYGIDEEDSFPSVVQEKIDAKGLNYTVVNAGLSGETTAGGLGRIDWVLNQEVDIFILELGGNDMLRGLKVEESDKNLRGIIEAVRKKDPQIEIILAGMQAAPNLGQDYTSAFNAIYSNLAKELNCGLIPFLLKDVGGMKSLNQADGIHPNVEGAKIVAENVWEVLEGYLK